MDDTKEKSKWTRFREKVLNLIFPMHIKCIFCDEELSEEGHNDTCFECQQILPYIIGGCPKCGDLVRDGAVICDKCKAQNRDFDQAKAVFMYKDEIVNVVHKLKYENLKFLAEPIAKHMCELYATWGIDADIVTSVPLHKNKEKSRKFNQAKEIAKEICKVFDLRYEDLCEKVLDNPSQTTLTYKQRQENVKSAYSVVREQRKLIKDKTIMLVDDVFTTGATANELSRILKEAGAKAVFVLTFAHSVIENEEEKDG